MKPQISLTGLASLLLAAGHLHATEITVFAAASLTNALTEIGAAHEKATGDRVNFNFAGSNTLARQIEAGAPADMFLSADEAQMNMLSNKGLVVRKSRKDLLGNTLAIVTAKSGPGISKVTDLGSPSIRRISVGDPNAVPAGVYAKAYLEKLGLWEILRPKLVPCESVRAALAVVESGNVEAGIVYKTDAATSRNVKVALEIPVSDGPKIVYPVALVSGSRHAGAAEQFLTRLAGREAGAVFTKCGFILLNQEQLK
jgi:molybdate transport system substrate-binding protein